MEARGSSSDSLGGCTSFLSSMLMSLASLEALDPTTESAASWALSDPVRAQLEQATQF